MNSELNLADFALDFHEDCERRIAELEAEVDALRKEKRFGDEAIIGLVQRGKIMFNALDSLVQGAESPTDRKFALEALQKAGKVPKTL